MKHIISLGAGVQSSTMALMAAHGEITPMPDCAIFADTQAEPQSVYTWLDWLETQLPFPVHRVTNGSLTKEVLRMRTTKDGRKYSRANIPVFTKSADGREGKLPFRSCTGDFKIKPLYKKQREVAEIKRGQKTVGCMTWIGISTDEATRMRTSREAWCENRYPLIDLRMTRQNCHEWMEAHGYPQPPRSACVYCPFHDNSEWRRLKYNEPDEFEKAVQFERLMQNVKAVTGSNFTSIPYLHRQLVPLDQVDFSTLAERNGQVNLFENECEGMCGV